MSWLDNLEQYIWDLYIWDSFSSGSGIIRNNQNYSGTSRDDIVSFAQRLFYMNPYNSEVYTYGGDDIIETIGVPSSSKFDLGRR